MCKNPHRSRSLSQVISEDRQAGPDSGPCRALCQDSTQAELAFKHTDRRFYAAAKPLQLSEPLGLLMGLFFAAQATHLRDANFLNTGLAKLHHVIGTIVTSIGGQFLRLYANGSFACRITERSSVLSLGLPM
jgi:hypothetical protein